MPLKRTATSALLSKFSLPEDSNLAILRDGFRSKVSTTFWAETDIRIDSIIASWANNQIFSWCCIDWSLVLWLRGTIIRLRGLSIVNLFRFG